MFGKKKKKKKKYLFFFSNIIIFSNRRGKEKKLVNRTNVPLRRWSCDVFGILDTDRYSYTYEDSSYRENAVLAGIQKIGLVSRLARVHTYLCVWIETRGVSKTASLRFSLRKNVCNSLPLYYRNLFHILRVQYLFILFFSAKKSNIRRVIYSLPSRVKFYLFESLFLSSFSKSSSRTYS